MSVFNSFGNHPVGVEILGLVRREGPPVVDGGQVDETHYPDGVDHLPCGRYGCGTIL
jgi:hypothetical protein